MNVFCFFFCNADALKMCFINRKLKLQEKQGMCLERQSILCCRDVKPEENSYHLIQKINCMKSEEFNSF